MAPRGSRGGQPRVAARVLSSFFDVAGSGLPRSPQLPSGRHSSAGQIARAHAFGFRVVAAWWRALTSNGRRPPPLRQLFAKSEPHLLRSSDAALADGLGSNVAQLSPDVGSPRILVENIATRLRGFESDSFGAWLSQVTLDAILLPITLEAKKAAAGRGLGLQQPAQECRR